MPDDVPTLDYATRAIPKHKPPVSLSRRIWRISGGAVIGCLLVIAGAVVRLGFDDDFIAGAVLLLTIPLFVISAMICVIAYCADRFG